MIGQALELMLDRAQNNGLYLYAFTERICFCILTDPNFEECHHPVALQAGELGQM